MAEEPKEAAKPAEPEQKAPAAAGSVAVPAKSKSNKKLFIILGAVVLFLFILPGIILALALTWFSRGDNAKKATESLIEKSIESATDGKVDVDTKDGSYSVKGEDGSEFSVGASQDYADDFPSDVPKYPGGKVLSAVRTKGESSTNWANTVETSDSSDKVSAFFAEKLTAWTNSGEFSYNNVSSTSYKKGDLSLSLTVSKSDGKTSISYTVSKDTKTP